VIDCARCDTPISRDNIHHINGNHEDDSAYNRIGLCGKCHDLVQGICDKCTNQGECHIKKFQECWHFEDALPPIYFRMKEDPGEEGFQPKEESLYEKRSERVVYFGKVRMTRGFCKKCGAYSLRVDGKLLCCTPDMAPDHVKRPYPPYMLQARCKICRKWFWNLFGHRRSICPKCEGQNVQVEMGGMKRPRRTEEAFSALGEITPLKAIRKRCLECAGSRSEVRKCEVECLLSPYRFGRNPARKGVGSRRKSPVLLRNT